MAVSSPIESSCGLSHHSDPSAAVAMSTGEGVPLDASSGTGVTLTWPSVVIVPIIGGSGKLNARVPFCPSAMPHARAKSFPLACNPVGNSVIVPVGLTRSIVLPSQVVNQTLPSGPAVIWLRL